MDKFVITKSRKIKKEVLILLGQSDLDMILKRLQQYSAKNVINSLFSGICRVENRIRWHSISSFGHFVSQLADTDMEEARMIMRRLLWSLNDESGGIGWGAPEALGEIMYCHKRLADEYIHMLISYCREDGPEMFQDGNYLELPQLQRGLLWGIGRLAGRRNRILNEKKVWADLTPYLTSDDATVCAMAIWGLGQLKCTQVKQSIKDFLNDTRQVTFYFEGQITKPIVGDFAATAFTQLNEN